MEIGKMSRGKYSPAYPRRSEDFRFDRNCYGEVALPYQLGVDEYNSRLHFDNYDEHGYDRYGYSAFYEDGTWAGDGDGVDRLGYTELEYLTMSDNEWENVWYCISDDTFTRKCPGIK